MPRQNTGSNAISPPERDVALPNHFQRDAPVFQERDRRRQFLKDVITDLKIVSKRRYYFSKYLQTTLTELQESNREPNYL